VTAVTVWQVMLRTPLHVTAVAAWEARQRTPQFCFQVFLGRTPALLLNLTGQDFFELDALALRLREFGFRYDEKLLRRRSKSGVKPSR
jgi:hypothetical protein